MVTQKEFFNRGLPKWPALLVIGKPVTKEQAAEILIRTASFHFSTNDHDFSRELYAAIGVTSLENGGWSFLTNEGYAQLDEAAKNYNLLSLDYLQNRKVVSSWIGGPHGWCDWSGYIGCNNYNIGKWPGVEAVFTEWQTIALAFPFLTLKSQLFSGETSEESIVPVVQFNVENGAVTMVEPEMLGSTHFEFDANFFNQATCDRERGCTLEQFKEALKIVESNQQVIKLLPE